jgi:hypothetical protein
MRPKSRENRLGFRIGEHQCATTSRSAYSILSGAQCTGGREIARPYPANYGAIFGFHEPPKLGNRRLVAGSTDIRSRYAGDAQTKKEEFTGLMVTWCLGTPFPRSALFLV